MRGCGPDEFLLGKPEIACSFRFLVIPRAAHFLLRIGRRVGRTTRFCCVFAYLSSWPVLCSAAFVSTTVIRLDMCESSQLRCQGGNIYSLDFSDRRDRSSIFENWCWCKRSNFIYCIMFCVHNSIAFFFDYYWRKDMMSCLHRLPRSLVEGNPTLVLQGKETSCATIVPLTFSHHSRPRPNSMIW